jgi:hypothetical protein
LERIQEEFLGSLPLYRHPVKDKLIEYMIFIDMKCIKSDGSVYRKPEFIDKLEEAGIPDTLVSEVKEYVREAELIKIELTQCNSELDAYRTTFKKAHQIYEKNRDERSSSRNTKVVQALGLSTGKTLKRLNRKDIYIDYIKFIRNKGLPRIVAVEKTRKKHGINSFDRTLQILFEHRSDLLEKWKKHHPTLVSEIESRLEGLIPSRR